MADYFPLIARAVAGLERNNGENRRALYERARTALVAQLRSVSPALNEADITRERLALEEAIRKVEGEATRRSREASDGGGDWDRADAGDLRSPPRVPPRPSLSDEGLKGFREVVAEAEGLGDATAQAAKSAREAYDAVPGAEPHPGEPRYGEPPLHPEPPYPERHDEVAHEDAPFPAEPEGQPPSLEPSNMAEKLPEPKFSEPKLPEQWPEPPPAPPRYDDNDEGYERPRRSLRGLIKILVILLLIGGVAVAGYWQRAAIISLGPKITALVSSLWSSPLAPAQRETIPARPKITDRVGGTADSPAGRSATAPTADVAQKVVLYDEDNNDPQGKRYVGSAIWRTETVSPGPGLAPELAIRADVDIPERHMRMTWSLRRNSDKALPASHTIEIMFTLAADFADGGIANVPGVLMKQNEQTRGVPLAGLAVKVTNGFFLIGLSAVDVDLQRNVQLLKERSWFDVPLVYNTGKRAILAIEKGTPGERVFEEAFRTWAQ
jgi:hypothetical protein